MYTQADIEREGYASLQQVHIVPPLTEREAHLYLMQSCGENAGRLLTSWSTPIVDIPPLQQLAPELRTTKRLNDMLQIAYLLLQEDTFETFRGLLDDASQPGVFGVIY